MNPIIKELYNDINYYLNHSDFDLKSKYNNINKINQIYNILKNDNSIDGPFLMYFICKEILNDRHVEYEDIILRDIIYTFLYMSQVIKKDSNQIIKWAQAEKLFLTSPHYASIYSMYYLQKRWEEAESIIKNNIEDWLNYKKHFNIIE